MWNLMRDGGFGMYPILLCGVITLATSGFFAAKASSNVRGFIDAMAKAILFFTLTGIVTDLTSVCHYLSQPDIRPEQTAKIFIEGFGESMSPGIMGFSFLALIHLLVAVGQRRLDAKELAG